MSEAGTKTKRIQELDIMKGIGIILIAVYHIVFRSMDGIPDKTIRSLGWAFIGIFFLLSGYTCRVDISVKECYRRRVMNLLIPVIMLEIVLLVLGGAYCILFHDYTTKKVLYDSVVTFLRPEISTRISSGWGEGGILFYNLSPVWFIWSMAWTELFFHPLRMLTIGKGKGTLSWVILVFVLLVIQVPMYVFLRPAPWGLTIVPTYLLFMLIGAKLRDRKAFQRLMDVRPLPAVIATVLCLAAHYGLFLFNGNESYYISKYGNRGALDVFTVLIQVLFATPAIYFISRGIGRLKPLSKGFAWFGRHTLGVLLMHCIIAVVYCDLLHNYIKPGTCWYPENIGIPLTAEIILKSILTCALSLLTCIPLILLWDKFRTWLFGRYKTGEPGLHANGVENEDDQRTEKRSEGI